MDYASNAESLRPVEQGCAKSIGRRAIYGIVRKERSVNGWDFAGDAAKRNRLPEAIIVPNVTNLNMNVCDQKTTWEKPRCVTCG